MLLIKVLSTGHVNKTRPGERSLALTDRKWTSGLLQGEMDDWIFTGERSQGEGDMREASVL